MKNLRLKMKLLISLAVIILATLVLGITAFVSIRHINNQVNVFAQKAVPNTKYSQQIQTQLEKVQINMLRALIENDLNLISQQLQEVNEDTTNLNNIISLYKQNASIDISLFSGLENALKQMANAEQQMSSLLASDDEELNNQAYAIYKNDFEAALNQAESALSTIINAQEDMIQKQVEESNTITSRAYLAIIIILILSIIISMIMVKTLSVLILTPLNQVLYAMEEMSKGNVHTTIEYESKDEFGEMADSVRSSVSTLAEYITQIDDMMHRMSEGDFKIERAKEPFKGDFSSIEDSIMKFVDKISDTLQTVAESSVQVSSGASQVSSGAQALSQGTTEQASSVEQLSATITEISNQVSQNAENANQANQKANQVESEASESSNRMKNMLQAMEDISNSSSEIGKIIKTIEDIAFQTNILALNAAVEGAGAAGKGFAVVADEVRTLAGKSAEASKNTAMLIENSIKAVKNGEEIANQTAESLNEVVGGVQEVANIINKISVASSDQSSAINQVTLGMEQISAVIQTNSATAQQSAAASEQLSSQSEMLKSLISQFKLKGNTGMEDTVIYKPIDYDTTEYDFQEEQGQSFDSKY